MFVIGVGCGAPEVKRITFNAQLLSWFEQKQELNGLWDRSSGGGHNIDFKAPEKLDFVLDSLLREQVETRSLGLELAVTDALAIDDMQGAFSPENAIPVTDIEEAGLRGKTGYLAECYFKKTHAENSEPVAGELLDCRYDQCGFDFKIETDRGTVAIEVKGLGSKSGGITFTDKEWRVAEEMREQYFLALVADVYDDPQVRIVQDPFSVLNPVRNEFCVIQVGYSVSQKQLGELAR